MRMTSTAKFAAILTAIALNLTGCGGEGESASAPATPTNPTSPTETNCPDGSAVPATGSANCPMVQVASTNVASGATVDPRSFTGITATLSGKLDPTSVTGKNVTFKCGADIIDINASLSADGKTVNFTSVVRLPFGRTCPYTGTAKDTLGRTVTVSGTFTTAAMVCTDNSIWSNPAVFLTSLQSCRSQIGVQWLVNPAINTLQDNSCTISTGVLLTPACKLYMANGTMVLAETSTVVNGHATTWMDYIGTDGKSYAVLLDTNDPNAVPVPLGKIALSGTLLWVIGNPTGESISVTTVVNGVKRTALVTWNASSSTLVETCVKNCS